MMTTPTVHKDPESLTMTISVEFDTAPERVWQLWADPRQLERWWGPPTHPATFPTYDLKPGERIVYHMTGPEGDRHYGYWDVDVVEAPHTLVFRDGFAEPDGSAIPELPEGRARVTIEEVGTGRTRMTVANEFPSLEAMDQVLAMGMEEGMVAAMGQIDAILAEAA
jgi:uncharacterized protein YndB with AHSA1/START domain